MMLEEMETSGNEMRALAVGAGLLYNGTDGTKSCFDIYEDFIECADITGDEVTNYSQAQLPCPGHFHAHVHAHT